MIKFRKHDFIRLLELGETAGFNGIDLSPYRNPSGDQIGKWGEKEGLLPPKDSPDYSNKRNTLHMLLKECFVYHQKDIWHLKNEYYFRLLEYRELEESRLTAKRANCHALWAIALSVVAIVITAVVSYLQLTDYVQIEPDQIDQIIRAIPD